MPSSSSHPVSNWCSALGKQIRQWLDSDYFPGGPAVARGKPDRFEWQRSIPFIFLHAGCFLIFAVGFSWIALAVAVALYFVRMFAITGFYHRYFSHRSFQTSRLCQFIFATLGNTAVQRGALWWAAVHRHHHKYSDQEDDVHSPGLRGFWWAHIGWMTTSKNFPTNYRAVGDFAKYPELVFLNRFDMIVPVVFGALLFGFGALLNWLWPALGTSGAQIFVWGFFVSTTALLHGTLFINSLAHIFGTRRFKTSDESRNSALLAAITLGEGWHNNHHRYMASARQGFYWWEFDLTYYGLKVLSWTGLIWGLKPVPASVYEEAAHGGRE